MDTSKLKIGEELKNYKELCNSLGLEVKQGNSKKYQIKEIERFIKYSKDKHSFIIEEIYKEPKSVVENKRNLPDYIKYMEVLLLDCLQNNKTKKMTISKIRLAEQLMMIHSDFNKYYGKRQELSNILNIDMMHIQDFMNTTSSAYKNAINTVLKRLESRSIIMYDTRWKTVYKRKWIMADKVMEQVKTSFATDEEKDIILETRYNLLKQFGGNMQEVYRQGKIHEFNRDFEDLLFSKIGKHNAYKVYDININTRAVESEYYKSMESLMNDIPDGQLKSITNHMWADRNLERMEDKIKSSYKLVNSEQDLSKYQLNRLNNDFEESMSILNNSLIICGINK